MAFELRELSGSLFKNERKTEDNHPNLQGRCKIDASIATLRHAKLCAICNLLAGNDGDKGAMEVLCLTLIADKKELEAIIKRNWLMLPEEKQAMLTEMTHLIAALAGPAEKET